MFQSNSQRSLRSVPIWIWLLLLISTLVQVAYHAMLPSAAASAETLGRPISHDAQKIQSLGEPIALGKSIMLWLQGFDNQPGISVPFASLDYNHVIAWLDASLTLDPKAQYPLLAAARLYAEVPDPRRQRQMLEFVFARFNADPERRWPWLAHAAIVAKHRLHDPALALKYARALADTSITAPIPSWARHMDLILLEEAGERETVKILIGGLIASGKLASPQELHFWEQRLEQLKPVNPANSRP